MATSAISSYIYSSQKVTIYFGIPILIVGLIGSLLNIIVFRSIKIFRQNSCIFYLTIMSIANIGQLLTGFLPRILLTGFNVDLTRSSIFYCKFKWYSGNICGLMSISCMCFAAIDRFLVTCRNLRWRKWSNIKVAHVVILITMFIWLIYGIPYLIYNNVVSFSSTGQLICISTNMLYNQYHAYSSVWLFGGFLPLFVNGLFGLLAYLNIQRLSGRSLPLTWRELERQLTMIVLIHIIYNFIAIVPFLIFTILVVDIMIMKDPLMGAKIELAIAITTCLFYLYFSSPFYIYVCVSQRFRHRFIHMFFKNYFKRQRQRHKIHVIS